MTRAKTVTTAAAAALAGVLLAGCGIKSTGVIDSGDAAQVQVPGAASGPVLYFVSADGDRLVPYPLLAGVDSSQLVKALLVGPSSTARESGITTALPSPGDLNPDALVIEYSPTDGVTVRLPFAVGRLSELARRQVVCTLAFAIVPGTVSPVTVTGTDTSLGPAQCDLKG
ncbi:GerMN domain-containing protein [Streptomyces sp. NPDC060031]|uniref:GerMN domain-containing protein n=1 Tax=Streptomyces sp. NPDC060031 TaxID=3347043 RepID=UPI0036741786